jgi:hypothetical protein
LQLQEEHAARQREHDKVVADSAVMLGDLQGWQERAEALLGELERERAAHADARAQHAAAVAEQGSMRGQLEAAQAAVAADRSAAGQREATLLADKAQVTWLSCAPLSSMCRSAWHRFLAWCLCCPSWLTCPVGMQLTAAVAAASRERGELQTMVQQAATEMRQVQQRLEEGVQQQVCTCCSVGAYMCCPYQGFCAVHRQPKQGIVC